ncbi:TetR/AcrR family transcriptional regulator [Couchioplanes caeruleus]|uniref:TetR family transcriptional regulator n=2 Tax=Couchioplanes caeruleus TaxID=56438 RepID=A0A1K0GL20_9ACTN|nr:TetR/AcrR family transcriptional regulator [Couchioplanes caeruleus]OJF09891.1 TetR family transcriptional regulator [Couchioplanes caeruleus subsp. caeruleus]ROP27690.1 TetR family transcriptional regulator [Couchioplanes caeruleus]
MARTRLTAEERQEQLLRAALTAFSAGGYSGTTTDQVARLAGVSQPYVIRIFGTKQQLFLDTVRRAGDRIEQRFRRAAAEEPTLASLGAAYDDLLAERELITVLLHGFTASADPSIGPVVRDCFGRIYRTVRELTGAGEDEARGFLAEGMLLTCLGAMRVVGPDAVPREPWMIELLGPDKA